MDDSLSGSRVKGVSLLVLEKTSKIFYAEEGIDVRVCNFASQDRKQFYTTLGDDVGCQTAWGARMTRCFKNLHRLWAMTMPVNVLKE